MRHSLTIVLVLLTTASLHSKLLRPLSLRELTYRADAVVVAVPLPGKPAGRFKVTQVLRGGPVQVGDTIALTEADRNAYSLVAAEPSDPTEPDEGPAPPNEALLYLTVPLERSAPPQLVFSGLFLGTADGEVFAPQQINNPGPFHMVVREGLLWRNVVKDAKTTAAAVEDVLRLKSGMGKNRTTDLLKWIEQHRLEFGGGFHASDRTGWGSLETDIFEWICEKGRPDECWAAARLYAELNHNAALPLKRPYFGTPAGRNLLLEIALDNNALDGDRARALTLLSNPHTLTPSQDSNNAAVSPIREDELVSLVKKLMGLTEAKGEVVRFAALQALNAIRSQHGNDTVIQKEMKDALPGLVKMYKAEAPGFVRDLFVETIHAVGGPGHWKEVSGSPHGMAVLLYDFRQSPEEMVFWFQVLGAKEKLYEQPTLVLERLGSMDKVMETKTLPLPLTATPPWQDGWTPTALPVRVPITGLTGTWRVSIRGTVDKDKAKWTSEPHLYVGPASPNPHDRRGYRDDIDNKDKKE